MNSKQASRCIKRKDGQRSQKQNPRSAMEYPEPLKRQKPAVMECPRWELVNALGTKYGSNCSYPLTPEEIDQIKQGEEEMFK
jgi:hypothetical protein